MEIRRRFGMASSALGVLIALVGAAFVGTAMAAEWETVVTHARRATAGWLLAAFALASSGMVVIALVWWRTLRLAGVSAPPVRTLRWYFLGELGKYVPGGVWAVVGRGALATGKGAGPLRVYGTVLLSLAATYVAGMVLVLALLPFQGQGPETVGWAPWLVVPVVVAVAASHPAVLGRLPRLVRSVSGRELGFHPPRWRASLSLILAGVPAWLALGTATWCVARSMGVSAPPLEILFASTLAWVSGFLVVPAPGGIGVREAVFVLAAGSLSSGTAAAVAVMARVLSLAVDGAGAALMLVVPAPGRPVEEDAAPSRGRSDRDPDGVAGGQDP